MCVLRRVNTYGTKWVRYVCWTKRDDVDYISTFWALPKPNRAVCGSDRLAPLSGVEREKEHIYIYIRPNMRAVTYIYVGVFVFLAMQASENGGNKCFAINFRSRCICYVRAKKRRRDWLWERWCFRADDFCDVTFILDRGQLTHNTNGSISRIHICLSNELQIVVPFRHGWMKGNQNHSLYSFAQYCVNVTFGVFRFCCRGDANYIKYSLELRLCVAQIMCSLITRHLWPRSLRCVSVSPAKSSRHTIAICHIWCARRDVLE